MKKHFYSHIIHFEQFSIALDDLNLSKEEKEELLEIADANIHHVILDIVLTELPEEEKKQFLSHLVKNDHQSIWELLRAKASGIEHKIIKAVEEMQAKMHEDIKEAKEVSK